MAPACAMEGPQLRSRFRFEHATQPLVVKFLNEKVCRFPQIVILCAYERAHRPQWTGSTGTTSKHRSSARRCV